MTMGSPPLTTMVLLRTVKTAASSALSRARLSPLREPVTRFHDLLQPPEEQLITLG
jgi:hypothetical protein